MTLGCLLPLLALTLDSGWISVKTALSYLPNILLDRTKPGELTSTCRFRKLKSLYHDRFSSVTDIIKKNSRSTCRCEQVSRRVLHLGSESAFTYDRV